MSIKIKWVVCPASTGPYRSFHGRSWPSGTTECRMYFSIQCAEDYTPHRGRAGGHSPLKLRYRDDSVRGSQMRVFKREFATLAELKAFAACLNLNKLREQK